MKEFSSHTPFREKGTCKDGVEGVRKSMESSVIYGSVACRVPCARVPLWGILWGDVLALPFSFQVVPLLLSQGSPGHQ